jgi:hypothetical protein
MTHFLHLAADFTSVAKNIGHQGSTIGGVFVILMGGIIALMHWLAHRTGMVIGTLIIAAVVGMFFFDPNGVSGILKGTSNALLK